MSTGKNIYSIASSDKVAENVNVTSNKSKIKEELFWRLLETHVKLLTINNPEKYEQTLNTATSFLSKKGSLSVLNVEFEVK